MVLIGHLKVAFAAPVLPLEELSVSIWQLERSRDLVNMQ
jgi:hypothetical protein